MQCSKCNTINDPDSKFCKNCGQYLAIDTANERKPDDSIRVGELIYAAYVHKEAGRIEEAILACQGAITLNDRSASAHELLASLFEARGDIERAIEEYRKSLEIEPDNSSIAGKIVQLDDILHTPSTNTVHSRWSIEAIRPHLPIISAAASLIVVLLIGMLILRHNINKNRSDVQQIRSDYTQQQPIGQYPQTQTNPAMSQSTPEMAQQQSGYPNAQANAQGQSMQANQQQTRPSNATRSAQSRSVPSSSGNGYASGSGPNYNSSSNPMVRLPGAIPPTPIVPSGAPVITPINGESKGNSSGSTPVIVPVDQDVNRPQTNNAQPSSPEPRIIYKSGSSTSGSEESSNVSPIQPITDPSERAMRLQGSGNYEEAIRAYRDVLKETPNKGRVYQQMALSYQRAGKTKEAADSYRKAIEAYKSQLSAGRDPAEVERDIRACEAGLKTLGK